MKHALLFLFFLVRLYPICAQTVEAERAALNAALKDGSLTPTEVQARVKGLKEIEGIYPSLPYDTASGEIKSERIVTFEGVGKAQAFKRAKEWAALNFGSLEAVTDYEDAESGKLIFEGWVPIVYMATFKNIWGNTKEHLTSSRLLFSLVLTIKDGKAKVQYKNLQYRVSVAAYLGLSGVYMPAQNFTLPVVVAFPLAMSDPAEWKGRIDFLNSVMREMDRTITGIEAFLRETEGDMGF